MWCSVRGLQQVFDLTFGHTNTSTSNASDLYLVSRLSYPSAPSFMYPLLFLPFLNILPSPSSLYSFHLQTFKKLLHELVSTATEYISVSSTSAGTFTTTASKTTKTGLWELDQALSTTNTHIKSHTSLMVNKFEVRWIWASEYLCVLLN